MDTHHYLGALPKIGHSLWYVACCKKEWQALISFSAAAWKCAARDQWIGWHFRYQYDRLHLIANNSCFLILPEHHYPNLASRILSLCERHIFQDAQKHFGYPLLLLETFVNPQYFHGTIYRAANWIHEIMLMADQMRTLPEFFSVTFPSHTANRGDVIHYPAFWLFQRVQCYV